MRGERRGAPIRLAGLAIEPIERVTTAGGGGWAYGSLACIAIVVRDEHGRERRVAIGGGG